MKKFKIKIIFFVTTLGILFLIFALCNISTSKTSENMNLYFKDETKNMYEMKNNGKKKNYTYFDLGSNNGDSILSFFELEPRYPQFVERSFTYKNYGPEAETAEWMIYAFEANPEFESDLDETVRKINKYTNHRIKVFKQTAAWTYDGKIGFYVEKATGFGLGSSLDKKHPDVIKSRSSQIFVSCRDIATMVKSLNIDDFIVMKIDIEGAEYELILDFIKKDAIRWVDSFAVEYHPQLKKFDSTESVLNAILKLYGATFKLWV